MSDSLVEAIAGAAGAVVATFITYPISTLSTFQSVRKERNKDIPSLSRFLDTFYQLTVVQGWERLYDGVQPALVGAAAQQGIYFYFYSFFKRRIKEETTALLTVPESMFVGYLAGCVNVIITNPIWVIATRIQAYRRRDQSLWSLILTSWSADGYQWMYKGILPSLILASNPAIQHTIYEFLKKATMKKTDSKVPHKLSSKDIFWMTTISKLCATLLTYPLLTVKARLQVYESRSRQSYQNLMDAITTIYEEEGWTGFYNGVTAKCIQSIGNAVITMIVKERVTNALLYPTNKKPKSKEKE